MPQDALSGRDGTAELALLADLVADLQKRLAGAEDKDAPGLVGALLKALERRAVVVAASRGAEDRPGSIAAVTKKLRSVGHTSEK